MASFSRAHQGAACIVAAGEEMAGQVARFSAELNGDAKGVLPVSAMIALQNLKTSRASSRPPHQS